MMSTVTKIKRSKETEQECEQMTERARKRETKPAREGACALASSRYLYRVISLSRYRVIFISLGTPRDSLPLCAFLPLSLSLPLFLSLSLSLLPSLSPALSFILSLSLSPSPSPSPSPSYSYFPSLSPCPPLPLSYSLLQTRR